MIAARQYTCDWVTINGITHRPLRPLQAWPAAELEGPPDLRPYEVTATMQIVDHHTDLDALAWRAVVTPSTEAPDALAILADALLERGVIAEVPETTVEDLESLVVAGRVIGTTARSLTVLEQAWEWAKDRAGPPFFERMLNAIRGVAPSVETATGAALDRYASLYGLQRLEPVASIYRDGDPVETDEELRARLTAIHQGSFR
jgi:hypothetical protein